MVDGLPILMGEAPSRSGNRYRMFPLSGRVAESLCRMADIPPMAGGSRYGQWTWALYEVFECMNLIERYPGGQGRGAAFPMEVARRDAPGRFMPLDGRVIVLLGRRLSRVLGIQDVGFGEWRTIRMDRYGAFGPSLSDRCTGLLEDVWAEHLDLALPRACVVSIPHPSGLNRMYNSEVERQRAGDVLRCAIRMAIDVPERPPAC